MERIRKDKYCLKGEYYEALETINSRLGFVVPKSFRKEVYIDLLELLFRNQRLGKPLNKALGKSLDDFIDELVETYYLTLGKGKFINYFLQNGFLCSFSCIMFYIINSSFNGSNVLSYSFATLIMGMIGFLGGIIHVYTNYKCLYKFTGYKKHLFQVFFMLWPLYFVIFGDNYIFNLTKNIIITKNVVLGIIIVEAIIYLVLVLLFRYEGKRD